MITIVGIKFLHVSRKEELSNLPWLLEALMLLPASILSRIIYHDKFATFETYLTANKILPHSVFIIVSAISGLNIPMAVG